MKTTSDKSLQVLHNLIEVCTDGQKGFETAANDGKDRELAHVFQKYGAQRAAFVVELQQRVRTLRGNPDESGSISASLHRGWMDLKAALASNEPQALLAECERGEDAAVKNYRDALGESDLDEETRRLVQTQYESVQATHDRIRQLRDSAVYAHR